MKQRLEVEVEERAHASVLSPRSSASGRDAGAP